MQFSRDAHALVHLSVDPDIELFCNLAHAIAINEPDSEKRCQCICRSEPPGVPPGRLDDDFKFCSRVAPLAAVRGALHTKRYFLAGRLV